MRARTEWGSWYQCRVGRRPRSLASAIHRPLGCALASILALGVATAPVRASANPNEGEGRSLLRDPDRVYTVVAGEADASATVQNPANLGFLDGIGGIFDASFTAPSSRRRGSGLGAFVGVPLPFDIASLGVGYQWLWPAQQSTVGQAPQVDSVFALADESYSKLTFALALPLMRWVSGLSLGVNYSRLFSSGNPWAVRVNQVDLAGAYRINRFFGLGLVARGLNAPRITSSAVGFSSTDDTAVRMPVVLDPEVVLRPTGRDNLEIGLGARIDTAKPPSNRFVPSEFYVQPRARLLVHVRGVRLFGEGELYSYHDGNLGDDRLAARISTGLELNLGHVGFAGGMNLGAGSPELPAHGGVARVRISQDRYTSALPARPRRVTRIPLSKYGGDRGMWRLIGLIEDLGQRRAGVILIETEGMRLSFAQIEEVREALRRYQSGGGQVVAYLEGGNLKSYFLASAADRRIAHPERELAIVGMQLRSLYYGEILERLGARAEFVRIAEYKGAAEIFARPGSTEPVRAQRDQLLADVWNHVLRMVARDRGQDPLAVDAWIDAAPHPPRQAVQRGIVDDTAWPDELDERLETWLGRKVRIEQPPKTPRHDPDLGPRPEVAVLYIAGDLATGPSFTIPILGRKVAGSDTLVPQIKKLRKDDDVKAVVVRINSGGGSVAAAENITRELDLLAKDKPVVVSFSTAAGSGAYYIATAGDYIVADATTITGSIGIFYPKVDLSGALEKFGIGVEITSLGDMATLRSWFKPYSPEELETAMRSIEANYDTFVERVANARVMTPRQVDDVAGGRVWSGVRAIEVGLVDRYGGLNEAVARARRMASMRPDELSVGEYPKPPGLLQQIRTLFGLQLDLPIGRGDGASIDADLGAGKLALGRSVGSLVGALPAALRIALSELPASFWLAEGPEAMALSPEELTLE